MYKALYDTDKPDQSSCCINCFNICTNNIYEDENDETGCHKNYDVFIICSLLLMIVFGMCILALIFEGVLKDPLQEILNSFFNLLCIFIFSYIALILFAIILFLISYMKLCYQSCKVGYKNRYHDYRYFHNKIEVVTNKELIIN